MDCVPVGIDVDAADDVVLGVQHGIGEADALREVVRMALEIAQVVLQRPVVRPRTVLPAGSGVNVVARGRPGRVVDIVVLGLEGDEPEQRGLEADRNGEVRRHERVSRHAWRSYFVG